MEKALLIFTNGYEISVTEYKTFEDAQKEMETQYRNHNNDETIPDEFREMSYIDRGDASCYTGNDVFMWIIHTIS